MSENPLGELIGNLSEETFFNKDFLSQRKIFLWGPVMDDSAKDIINRLLYLEAKEPGKDIQFFINSPGGSVTAGMAIFDAINMISSDVSTICVGHAASMGAVLLSCGTKGKRFVWPSAEVMIHQPSIGGYFSDDTRNLEITAKQIMKTKEQLSKVLAKNCDKTYEQIVIDSDRDYWMDAKESIAYGIVDGIATKF